MKHLFTITFLSFTCLFLAQQGDGGKPKGFKSNAIKKIEKHVFSEPNIEKLRVEDSIVEASASGPWRFGFNNSTQLNTQNSGTWITLPNGDKIWFLLLECKNALTINLTFSETQIPEGNELYIYNPTKDFILGKFKQNHLYEGQLGSELIPGSVAIVEYYVPKKNSIGKVNVCTVTHGYRTANEFQEKAFGTSGSCNKNVNCPEGAQWTNERNSVVMLVSGSSGFCTGALVNNTANDGKPYVLTADHCFSNPATWIFRFQWQAPDCNKPAISPSFQSLSGAVLRARATASDFCLVEITGGLMGGTVPGTFTPYFAGWDNSGATPQSGTGIHHPDGDIKKISIENDALISTSFGSCPPNSHWGVTNWDSGVTEGGSSGSPLFDQNHRIIGQLHGGISACGLSTLSDEYGKFSYSWNPLSSDNSNQLKYWLDPQNTGAQFLDGYDPSGSAPKQVDAGITNPQGVTGRLCSADIIPSVTITNSGAQVLSSATIVYSFDGGANQTFSWTGNLPQWQSAEILLPNVTLAGGTHLFIASVENPNASLDEYIINNTLSSSFDVVLNASTIEMNLTLDCYGSEISWDLSDSVGTILYSSAGYSDNLPGLVQSSWCLNKGCYTFLLKDSYGDGLTGDQSCSPDGSLLIALNGDSLTGISQAEANFGTSKTLNFCVNEISLFEKELSELLIFPNPAKESFTVSWNSVIEAKIDLVNLFGQRVISTESFSKQQVVIPTQNIASGTYFVVFSSEGKRLIRKIVIN